MINSARVGKSQEQARQQQQEKQQQVAAPQPPPASLIDYATRRGGGPLVQAPLEVVSNVRCEGKRRKLELLQRLDEPPPPLRQLNGTLKSNGRLDQQASGNKAPGGCAKWLQSNQFEVQENGRQFSSGAREVRKYEQLRPPSSGGATKSTTTRTKFAPTSSTKLKPPPPPPLADADATAAAARLNCEKQSFSAPFGRPFAQLANGLVHHWQQADEMSGPTQNASKFSIDQQQAMSANQHKTSQNLNSSSSMAANMMRNRDSRGSNSIRNQQINNYCITATTTAAKNVAAGDSSGFSSEGSSNASVTSSLTSKQSSLIRSQLLEDLNRLEQIAAAAAAAKNIQQQQPAAAAAAQASNRRWRNEHAAACQQQQQQVALSGAFENQQAQANGTTMEFDYSTLCRDEFSSFIPNEEHFESDTTTRDRLYAPLAADQHRRASSSSSRNDCATLDHSIKQRQSLMSGCKSMSSLEAGNLHQSSKKLQRARSRHRELKASSRKSRRDRLAAGPSLVGVHEFELAPLQPQASFFSSMQTSAASESESGSDSSSASSTSQSSSSAASSSALPRNQQDNTPSSLELSRLPPLDCDPLLEQFPELLHNESFEQLSDNENNCASGEFPTAAAANERQFERQMRDQDDDSERVRLESGGGDERFEAHVEEFFSDETSEPSEDYQDDQDGEEAEERINFINLQAKQVPLQDELAQSSDQDLEKTREDYCQNLKNDASEQTMTTMNLCSSSPSERTSLSKTLDVYLERVECLLRLASGDKSISLQEAFNQAGSGDEDDAIQVSAEFKTQVNFEPVGERPELKREVIQEIEMVEECEEEDVESNKLNLEGKRKRSSVIVHRNVLVDDFRKLLSSPQVSAKLNWWPLEETSTSAPSGCTLIDEKQRAQLERDFMKSWQADFSDTNENESLAANSRIISSNLSDFIKDYNSYQMDLELGADFATDWRSNWLFRASSSVLPLTQHKRNHDDEQEEDKHSKRVRMSMLDFPQNNYINVRSELLKYSTLLLANRKSIKMSTASAACQAKEEETILDAYYAQRPAYLDELNQIARELNNQVDVCRLLMEDDFDEIDRCSSDEDQENQLETAKNKSLSIKYDSSSLISGRLMSSPNLTFSAHGHTFELRKLFAHPTISSQSRGRLVQRKPRSLDKLKRLLLLRLRQACQANLSNERTHLLSARNALVKRDQVKFVRAFESVELSFPLAVIQFCAKITGALPINVRLFRRTQPLDGQATNTSGEFEEISGQNEKDLNQQEWPLTMEAKFDYEMQTSWSSKLRFKRLNDEILFEIRAPNSTRDYNQTYKCVIQNYCSIRECIFELRQKQPASSITKFKKPEVAFARNFRLQAKQFDGEPEQLVKLNKVGELAGGREVAGQAILRTWSQRTLKRPPLSTTLEPEDNEDVPPLPPLHTHTQTVGRLSAQVAGAGLFGSDYPYHPECLRRRLEDNKLSLTLRSGTIMRYQRRAEVDNNQGDQSLKLSATTIDDGERQQQFFNSASQVNLESSNKMQFEGVLGSEDATATSLKADYFKPKPTNHQGQLAEELHKPTPKPRQKPAVATQDGHQLAALTSISQQEKEEVSSGGGQPEAETSGNSSRLNAFKSKALSRDFGQQDESQSALLSGGEADRHCQQVKVMGNDGHPRPAPLAERNLARLINGDNNNNAAPNWPPAHDFEASRRELASGLRAPIKLNDENDGCGQRENDCDLPRKSAGSGASVGPGRSAVRSLISRFNNNN